MIIVCLLNNNNNKKEKNKVEKYRDISIFIELMIQCAFPNHFSNSSNTF